MGTTHESYNTLRKSQWNLTLNTQRLLDNVFLFLTILLPINTFVLPFDKLIIPIYIGLLLFTNKWFINKSVLTITVLTFLYITFISVINIGANSPLAFYPLLFSVAAILAYRNPHITTRTLKIAIFTNIIIGIVFLILAYLGFSGMKAHSLAEKGLPFIRTPLGFSPTTQVFGTMCVVWLLLAYETKNNNRWIIAIVLMALVNTLNRASLIFLVLLFFFYKKKRFYIIAILGVLFSIVYFETLTQSIFNPATVGTREQLRQGAEISYWKSADPIVLLFGRANHQTSPQIAQQTTWEQKYIENGLDFIFHTYGVVGFIIYLTLVSYLILYLIKRKRYDLASLSLYYFTILQFITNEFLSSSLFFFICTVLMIANSDRHTKKIAQE